MSVRGVFGKLLGVFLAERTPGPLAAAAALGLFLGLVPLLTPQALLAAAAVLFLRVNLTVTLAAAGLGGLASLALASVLDRLGVALLEAPSLGGWWAWLYHSPLSMLRTHEATTLGATLAGAALAGAVYLAVRWIAGRIRRTPVASTAGGDAPPPAPAPRARWLRRGALLPMTVVFLALLGGAVLARDGLLQAVAVASLESAFAARADVTDLATTLTPTVALERVAVADRRDPMRNLFEFDRFAGGVAFGPLLAGRVVIPELTVEGLKFGTARAESGALPETPAEPEPPVDPASAGKSFEQALDDLLAMLAPPELEELAAVREARALEAEGRERLAAIERTVRESTLPKRTIEARMAFLALTEVEAPESFHGAARAAQEFAALRPDLAALESVRADLAAAVPSFDAERKAIAAARSDLTAAGGAVDRAQALVKRAREIRKFTLQDSLKIAGLLKDLEATQRDLARAAGTLTTATNAVTTARESIERQVRDSGARLQSGQGGLARVQAALDRASDDLAPRAAALSGAIERARADWNAAQAKAEAAFAPIGQALVALGEEAQALRAELEAALAVATSAPARLTAALARDRDELARRYSMDRFSVEAVLGPAIGDEAVEWVRWTLATWERLQPLVLSKGEAAVPQRVQRVAGTVFTFPSDGATPPRFFVGKLAFTGTLELSGHPFELKGRAENLSSDLVATGADCVVEFEATHRERTLRATIRVTPAGEASVTLGAQGIPFSGHLKSRRLRAGFDEGRVGVTIEGRVGAGQVRAAARCAFEGLQVTLAEGAIDPRLGFLRDALATLTRVEAEVDLRFAGGRFESFRATAAGGGEFAERVKGALLDRVAAARDEAFARIEERLAGPRREALAALAGIQERAVPAVEVLMSQSVVGPEEAEVSHFSLRTSFKQLRPGFEVGPNPMDALAEARNAVAELTTKAAGLDGAAARAAADPLAAAGAAKTLSDQSRAALDAAQRDAKAEFTRLTGLR